MPIAATALPPPSASSCERESLRCVHQEAVRRLATLDAPPPLSVYDPVTEISHVLLEQVAYLRQVVDLCSPLFERVADDAADYAGARAESFDVIRAAVEDYLAPITDAADQLIDSDRTAKISI